VADRAALARIQHAAWTQGFVELLPEEFQVPAVERFAVPPGDRDTRRVVALDEADVPVGWVSFGFNRDPDRTSGTGELRALYVHPDHWGRGAGRALVSAALEGLPEMGYDEVTLWSLANNERANRLYEGAGFRRDGAERREPISAGALEVRYRRTLSG
jgi:ribosomal protein S18 acetylase RimI-like enzyme